MSPKFLHTVSLIFPLVAAACALQPIFDVDFGWHLAGGLWILDHRKVPGADPFGSTDIPWLSYSWLFQLIVGYIFEHTGFAGILVTQAVLAFFLLQQLQGLAFEKETSTSNAVFFLAEAVTLGLAVLALSPFLYLRPQLVSALFLCWAMKLTLKDELPVLHWLVLTIVWANIHVYWILAPGILALQLAGSLVSGNRVSGRFSGGYSARRNLALGALVGAVSICGFLTPYGLQQFTMLWELGFEHETAKAMIREFQPLTGTFGYPFYVAIAMAALSIVGYPSSKRKYFGTISSVLFIVALLQSKYLPLFVVSATPLAACGVQSLLKRHVAPTELTLPNPRVLIPLIGALLATLIWSTGVPPVLDQRWSALCELVDGNRNAIPAAPVVNHFDDGGWLAFCLYRGERGSVSLPSKTTVDGRTLVMGAERLKEFLLLRGGDPSSCDIVTKSWEAKSALLSSTSSIATTVRDRCGWKVRAENSFFQLLTPDSPDPVISNPINPKS